MESDANYFSRRAAEQRRAALQAASDLARQRHLEIAAAYEQRAARAAKGGDGAASENS